MLTPETNFLKLPIFWGGPHLVVLSILLVLCSGITPGGDGWGGLYMVGAGIESVWLHASPEAYLLL